jgi:hypothetical protein
MWYELKKQAISAGIYHVEIDFFSAEQAIILPESNKFYY